MKPAAVLLYIGDGYRVGIKRNKVVPCLPHAQTNPPIKSIDIISLFPPHHDPCTKLCIISYYYDVIVYTNKLDLLWQIMKGETSSSTQVLKHQLLSKL